MKNKLTKIILSALLLGAVFTSNAQDKATLDLLVSKGVITKEDADKVAKSSASIPVMAKEKATKKLTFSGRLQTQFESINVTGEGASNYTLTKDDFIMRRVFLGIEADIGSGWSGTLITDFCRSSANYIEYVYITKKMDYEFIKGALDFGYKKAFFGYEETTSAAKLFTIERSAASRYWAEKNNGTRLGFGGRYTGVFWNGKTPIDGLDYGVSVTNSFNDSLGSYSATDRVTGSDGSNTPNFWGYASYKTKISDVDLKFGANFGYSDGGNAIAGKNGSIYGINPYISLGYEGVTLWSELLVSNVEYGKYNKIDSATPLGVNVAVEYKFDIGEWGKIAPTIRYSWLNTDGRGVSVSDGVRNCPSGSAKTYDEAQSVYAGINWYIVGDSLKFQLGYEWAQYSGNVANSNIGQEATANIARAQIQVLF